MAWDDYERNGRRLMSGDDPIDELSLALRRIVDAYERQFSRYPYVDEILLSLERTIVASPDRFVEDPAGMEDARFVCVRPDVKPRQRIDFTAYEGYYADEPRPGHYGIERRGVKKEVIKVPRLEIKDRRLELDYEVLDPTIEDDSALRLIKRALLREFSDSYYAKLADEIVFRNLASGGERRMPYDEH